MFDINLIRNDFPMIRNNPELYYFDSGATSLKPQCVIDEINNYYNFYTANIHRGDYDISFRNTQIYDETRKTIADFIGANNPKEIVFTSGATASLNLVAQCFGLTNLKKDDIILTTQVEHASNILPWFDVCKKTGAKIKYIELNLDGTFNIDNYKQAIEEYKPKIVSITMISNVLGYKYPIKEICEIAHSINAVVNVDGAQGVPHMSVDVTDLDIDFLSFSAHKMGGPSGLGVLFGKYELLKNMNPLNYGGGSNARFENDGTVILKEVPEKFESGTPNIEAVLAFKKAIEYISSIGMKNIEEHDKQLTKYLIDELTKIKNITIYNPLADSGIVVFNIDGIFAQDVGSYLNSKKICVRTGNHCAKILHNVIGVDQTIRVSMYLYNTKEEIDYLVEVLKETTLEKCIGVIL